MKMIKWFFLIALIALAGCIDEKEELTINPDGSGKLFYSVNLKPMDLSALMGTQSATAPTVNIKDNLKKLLENSQGIDTWKDVSYKTLEDGRAHVEATGYFSDINKVILDKAVENAKKPEIKFTKTGDKIIVEFINDTGKATDANATAPALTDEQIDEQVKMIKMSYQQGKIMTQGFMKDMKFERIIHLPGEVTETSNFTKTDGNTVQIAFDGEKVMNAMDLMMADDAYLKEMIKKGNDPMQNPDEVKLNEMLFGEAAAVSAAVEKADKNLFDYKAEMEAAKADFPAMKDKLYAELDELAKKQPENNQTKQLQDLMTNAQELSAKADANDKVVVPVSDANSSIESDLIKALELEREKKMEEAIKIYLSAAENKDAKPKDVIKARTYLARSYMKTKEYEKAKEQLETLIKDFSDNRPVVLRTKKQLMRVKQMLGEPVVEAEDIEAMKEKLKNKE